MPLLKWARLRCVSDFAPGNRSWGILLINRNEGQRDSILCENRIIARGGQRVVYPAASSDAAIDQGGMNGELAGRGNAPLCIACIVGIWRICCIRNSESGILYDPPPAALLHQATAGDGADLLSRPLLWHCLAGLQIVFSHPGYC